jgi:hypothetical protein
LVSLKSSQGATRLGSIRIARRIFDDSCRVTSHDLVRRHVLFNSKVSSSRLVELANASTMNATYLGHNTSSSHGRALSDPHTRQNDYITTDPAVFFNPHFFAQLRSCCAAPNIWVQRMCTAVNRHVRSKQSSSTDGHQASVDNGAVEIDEDAFTHADIGPVVDTDWRLDPGLCCEESFVFVFCGSGWREGRVVSYDTVCRENRSTL